MRESRAERFTCAEVAKPGFIRLRTNEGHYGAGLLLIALFAVQQTSSVLCTREFKSLPQRHFFSSVLLKMKTSIAERTTDEISVDRDSVHKINDITAVSTTKCVRAGNSLGG